MLKSFVLAAAAVAAPAWSAEAQVVMLDGLSIQMPEAEFIQYRPKAAGANGWFMYAPEPEAQKEFGFPVRGYMRGFEGGRGCAAAVGFWKTSAADTEQLSRAIESRLLAHKMAKKSSTDAAGARFDYWEGPEAFASIDRLNKGKDHYAVSLQVALKSCPDSATKFNARPSMTKAAS
ncbi:hypothetical protein [Pseudoduganella sp. HUAS MS19]